MQKHPIYAIHEAGGQATTMQKEIACSLVTGGGKPGQGFPCVLMPIMVHREAFDPKTDSLNDQGGMQISISHGKTATLRAEDHGHPPVILDVRKV